MSRTIHVDVLSPESIDAAVKELRDYARWVERKADELRQRAADFLAIAAQSGFNTGVSEVLLGEMSVPGDVTVSVESNGNISMVVAFGYDVAFMEFGAGVYYNTPVGSSPNPLVTENGLPYTIGSYSTYNPGKTTWAFTDINGNKHVTHGTPASMPMYHARQLMLAELARIAKEVFSA